MIYSVVPKPLVDELYPKLLEHYRDNENVTVIVDRRKADRRSRHGGSADPSIRQQRVVRDRRRARVPGELPALARP
ncbi:MAG: hypothetical protein ACHQE6_05810 [Solirubrobacterales bacterium]